MKEIIVRFDERNFKIQEVCFMKFMHLSDLHIGLKLMNRDLKADQEYILKQVIMIAKEHCPDAIVIAGDIYDKAVPSAEAIEVFDHFLRDLTEAVPETVIMMISGNHDSAPRVDCFRSVLSKQKIYMIGNPPKYEQDFIEKVTLTDEYGNVNFYLLPFVKPSMVKQIVGSDENGNNLSYDAAIHKLIEREKIDKNERNVLVSHQFYLPVGKKAEDVERMESEILTVGNIDEVRADVLEEFDYAALGHIHKPMKVGSEYYRYCGTPMACSISEAGQKKGVIVVELLEKNSAKGNQHIENEEFGKNTATEDTNKQEYLCANIKIDVIPLIPLREVRVIKGNLEDILLQACDDYVTVILTDKVDLNVIDMQERIRIAFPNLLEIRRETYRKAQYTQGYVKEEQMNPFDLCCAFIPDMDEAEKKLMQEIINTVLGEEE